MLAPALELERRQPYLLGTELALVRAPCIFKERVNLSAVIAPREDTHRRKVQSSLPYLRPGTKILVDRARSPNQRLDSVGQSPPRRNARRSLTLSPGPHRGTPSAPSADRAPSMSEPGVTNGAAPRPVFTQPRHESSLARCVDVQIEPGLNWIGRAPTRARVY